MTRDELKARFSALPEQKKPYVLSLLAQELTVRARGCTEGSEEDHRTIGKLRVWNEIQHRVTGKLAGLLGPDGNGYPDEMLMDVLFDIARLGDCDVELTQAVERSFGLAQSVTV